MFGAIIIIWKIKIAPNPKNIEYFTLGNEKYYLSNLKLQKIELYLQSDSKDKNSSFILYFISQTPSFNINKFNLENIS